MAKGFWRNWEKRGGAEAKKRTKMVRCSYCGQWIPRKEMLEHLKGHTLYSYKPMQ